MIADDLLAGLTDEVEAAVIDEHGLDLSDGNAWREDPTDLDTFVTSRQHLGLPKLYRRQRRAVRKLLGGDPKRIFEGPRTEPLTWNTVRGRNVNGVAHGAGDLYVHFKDGTVYRYQDVPGEIAAAMRKASSAGTFLHRIVKPRFPAARLDQAPDDIRVGVDATRQHQIAVLLWGKGSGKDYVSSIVIAYCLHVLLCLRDPQGYFELAPGEPLDVINVAYNADQAKRVFFEKLKQRLKRWRWLRDNFNVVESGKRIGEWQAGKPVVNINDDWVEFPRQIRAFSRHAQNESYEGFNVIAWVMDEASAFLSKLKRENAESIFQTLKTSAASRFLQRWIGFIISYPRHADDFTMTKCRQAQRDPSLGTYGDGPAKTWEVNEKLGRGEFVEVRPGHHVPIELANDYLVDLGFEEALARYECLPPAAREALIRNPQRVWDSVAQGRKPVVEWEPTITERSVVDEHGDEKPRRFSAVRITNIGELPRGARLYFHGDPAVTNDAFALAIGHGVPAKVRTYMPASEVYDGPQLRELGLDAEDPVAVDVDTRKTIIDAVILWRPDPREDQEVDLLNVRDVVKDLLKAMRFRRGSFDKGDPELVQWVQARKVNCEDEAWTNTLQVAIYKHGRQCFYNDLVELPDTPSVTSTDPMTPGFIYELERVELIENRKIDHPEGGSKDIADAVIRVIYHAHQDTGSGFTFGRTIVQQDRDPRKLPVPGQKVDPKGSPSPITPELREADRRAREKRPLGELEPGTGTVRQAGRFSFTSVQQKR